MGAVEHEWPESRDFTCKALAETVFLVFHVWLLTFGV